MSSLFLKKLIHYKFLHLLQSKNKVTEGSVEELGN